MKESWYEPQPVNAPLRHPRRFPKRVVPSYIGEPEQVLNLLVYKGAGGVVKDYSGQGNRGEIHGAKWTDEYSPSWALNFDGENDYVDVTGIKEMTEITVLGWAKTDDDSDSQLFALDRNPPGALIRLNAGGTAGDIRFYVEGSDSGDFTVSGYDTKTWRCYALTAVDGGGLSRLHRW